MVKKGSVNKTKIGHYAFIAGLIVAVLIALVPQFRGDAAVWMMVILGVIVGLLNITAKETSGFLLASLVLIVSASTTALILGTIHTTLTVIWGNAILFVAMAAIVVSIKTVYALAQAK